MRESGVRAAFRLLIDRLGARGAAWTSLAIARRSIRATERGVEALAHQQADRLIAWVEKRMADIERDRHLTGAGTVSAQYQSYELNKRTWESWDWSRGGEEWTDDVVSERGLDPHTWKASMIELLESYVPPGSEVLEVGPGAGRWTEALLRRAGRVAVADIAPTCLEICRQRFGGAVEYYLVDDHPKLDLPAGSFEAVWSYDVFVHINPPGVDAWLAEISRLLRPSCYAVIHHADGEDIGLSPYSIGRSNLDADLFRFLAGKNGLEIIDQNRSLPHKRGDAISICRAT